MRQQKPKAMSDIAQAALPAEIDISRIKFSTYVARGFFDFWGHYFCTLLPWPMRRLPIVGERIYRWTRVREKFIYGCLIPAVVVDPDKKLVAVLSGLGAWKEVTIPVIKIYHEGLDLITTTEIKRGTRLAATSTYEATDESYAQGRWADVHPLVVDCFTDDPEVCKLSRQRLHPLSWKALGAGLQELGSLRKPGLYHVDLPEFTGETDLFEGI